MFAECVRQPSSGADVLEASKTASDEEDIAGLETDDVWPVDCVMPAAVQAAKLPARAREAMKESSGFIKYPPN